MGKSYTTHSAPKRAAATPKVPHPQPKSATTLLLTSPNEFSALPNFQTTMNTITIRAETEANMKIKEEGSTNE